jgi:hypothetical protein
VVVEDGSGSRDGGGTLFLGSVFFLGSCGRVNCWKPVSGAGSVSALLMAPTGSSVSVVKDTTLSLPFPLSNIPRLPPPGTMLSGLRAILNRLAIRPKTLVRLPSLSGDGGWTGIIDAIEPVDAFVGLDLESLRVRPFGGAGISI